MKRAGTLRTRLTCALVSATVALTSLGLITPATAAPTPSAPVADQDTGTNEPAAYTPSVVDGTSPEDVPVPAPSKSGSANAPASTWMPSSVTTSWTLTDPNFGSGNGSGYLNVELSEPLPETPDYWLWIYD